MDDKIYKITLSDETVLDNLRLNGNNFISSSEIDESVFDGNCSIVTINDGEKDEVHMNMELVQIIKVNDKYWFVLRDVPETELAFVKMQSDIEYVAMMSEIELAMSERLILSIRLRCTNMSKEEIIRIQP